MFTDDLNENWDSNAVQDAFIEDYFGKKSVTETIANCNSGMSFDCPKKIQSAMNCKNKNKAQKRKYSREISNNNNDKNILVLNDTVGKKVKKKKKIHDIFLEDKDVVSVEMEGNSDKESFNESQNLSLKLLKKEKKNKVKLKKSDKSVSENKARLNLHIIDKNNPVLSNLVEKKRKSQTISDISSQNDKISFQKNIKLDNHNSKDSMNVNSLSLKGKQKKKKKLKNKDKNLHQNETYQVINDKNQSEVNKSFKEKGKNKEMHDSSTEKDTVSYIEDIKQNFKESLDVDSNPLKKKAFKKKNRDKKLLQNQMPSNSHDLTSNQGNNFKGPPEKSERESDVSYEELSSKKSTLFQSKAYKNLQAAKFRYLNEMLYTNTGKDALTYFQQNVDEFHDYHTGYQTQVSKWPLNPVDIIIKELRQISKPSVIADLGCGEAKIAQVLSNNVVHSFDLIAFENCVTACDIANVPLPDKSVDVAVFCLSLMGTNWKDYLLEAHRILKLGGTLKIAEIESRCEDLSGFIKNIESYGFSLINKNVCHKMFIFLNFKKVKSSKVKKNVKSSKVKDIILKPCLYKKR